VANRAARPSSLALACRPEVRALLATMLESSTGVLNGVAIAEVVYRRATKVLLVVDAVSGLAAHDVRMET
jgi:aspartate aminotransferase-like enzyme